MEEVRVVLPKRFDLVTGDTFQLFYRGIIEAPNPYVYDILAVCEKGKGFPRYFELLTDEEGEYELTVSVYSQSKKLLGSGTTTLVVRRPRQPKQPINILCMGDSLTAGGSWPREACRRLTANDGQPCGLGFDGYNFVGSISFGEGDYEGYGGWIWRSYMSKELSGVWFFCEHDKDSSDQHTMWCDEDGRVWKLETILDDRLKFLRINHAKEEFPKLHSTLKPIDSTTHNSNIEITRIYNEIKSPFYDEETKKIDFKLYCEKVGVDKIDVVYVLLGINGLYEDKIKFDSIDSIRAFCNDVVNQGKEFVDELKSQFPDVKVRIMSCLPPSVTGGTGTNYGAKLPYCDRYGLTRYVFELKITYENWCNESEYKSFMEFIDVCAQVDIDNCYPMVEKPVNVRSVMTENIGVNGVHPTAEGYMMIADAAFRNMISL